MYGTVAKMRAKPGGMDELKAMSDEWRQSRAGTIDGFVTSYIFQMDSDPNECWLVAVFENQDTYRANAESPEQNEWYQQMRSNLEADPEWHDGEIIYAATGAKTEPSM